MACPTSEQVFQEKIFPRELEEIAQRRIAAGIERSKADGCSPASNLAGLSLSGGGIRSATFCLGVLQSFVEAGLFKEFDYMSTVSGGGYIGSTISSSLIRPDGSQVEYSDPPILPDTTKAPQVESELVRHLRDHSKYLAPVGRSSPFALPALVLLGFTTNVLLILPALILFAIMIRLLTSSSVPHPVSLSIEVFLVWAAIYAAVVSNINPSNNRLGQQRLLKGTILVISLLALFIFVAVQVDILPIVEEVLGVDLTKAFDWILGSLGALGVFFGVIGFVLNRLGRLASRIFVAVEAREEPKALRVVCRHSLPHHQRGD
jgi:hypothetical protein